MKTKSIFLILFFISLSQYAQYKNQNDILSTYTSEKYSVYKVEKVSYDKYKFVGIKKQWPINFKKSGNEITNILVKRAGILDENFKPDVSGYPAYFAFSTYRLTFIDNLGIYYSWNGKEQATVKYVFVKKGSSLNYKFKDLNKKVATYAKAVFKNQTSARANVKEKKAEIAETTRRQHSLQDKSVKKIAVELVKTPSKIAHFSERINYGIVATLTDGTVLKTPNLGGTIPWSDFTSSHKGCSNTLEEIRVEEDAKFLTDDRVAIHITSKYHPNLKAVKYLNATYNIPVVVNHNGFWGWERHKHMVVFQGVDGQHAGRGDELVIKVKTVSHKQTGIKINKIEIYNSTEQKVVARFKLSLDTNLTVNTVGGQGADGRKGRESKSVGGNGGSGGAGGNVSVIKDSSVKKFNITINNQGGKGGKGGAPYYSSGKRGYKGNSGDDGNTTYKTKNITLNF
jgi:hypothetical protein